ncbi:MAG TPA: oxidoreductase [Acidimicrobiales bacterium]|jgi:aryl-alcohol dehydrogenase-like predicted oxidoreductase|nr:oxidoreductase [Acidimicrobiales bacterium]
MPNETVLLAGRPVHRMGFGAMQLPGPGVFGPPRDRAQAVAVLRRAVESGVDHIDTSQFYGPDVANELIREALHPYPADLVLVSKVGAARDDSGRWLAAQRPEELRAGIEANLRSLGLEQVPAVNLRRHPDGSVPLEAQIGELVACRDEGLIGGVGLSNVTLAEYRAARRLTEVVCVQNAYNLVSRDGSDLFEVCVADGVPFVPFFPLGSAFSADNAVLQAPAVRQTAARLGATPAQIALAWLLALAGNVLLIPGTSSLVHLAENLAAAEVELDAAAMQALAAPELVTAEPGQYD